MIEFEDAKGAKKKPAAKTERPCSRIHGERDDLVRAARLILAYENAGSAEKRESPAMTKRYATAMGIFRRIVLNDNG